MQKYQSVKEALIIKQIINLVHPAEHQCTHHLTVLLQDGQCILQYLHNVIIIILIINLDCLPGFSPFTITLSPRKICCPLLQIEKGLVVISTKLDSHTWKCVLYITLEYCCRRSLLQDFVLYCTWSSCIRSMEEAMYLGSPFVVKFVLPLDKSCFSDVFSPTSF